MGSEAGLGRRILGTVRNRIPYETWNRTANSMDRLWAPWRAAYIRESAPRPDDGRKPSCFICDALNQTTDRDNLLAWRGPRTVVILNRFPYNNGHLLVAPRSHVGSLGELGREERAEPIETITRLIDVLDRMMSPHGYNIGLNLGKSAGAGLPDHLHWHVVPRWDGDTNFMPIVGEAKVIVESLDEFYDRLVSEITRGEW